MVRFEKSVEEHKAEHRARLKHINELLTRAEKTGDKESKAELEELKEKQTEMGDYIEQLKAKSPEQFMQMGGPMVMWELVAQRLEKLIEKIKK
ncbi:MAG: hypothetical protein L0Z73_08365 [Gammaproteobacteria bacterium]|nr:hypothetical protein [Gammaproteobacteria bacterium]